MVDSPKLRNHSNHVSCPYKVATTIRTFPCFVPQPKKHKRPTCCMHWSLKISIQFFRLRNFLVRGKISAGFTCDRGYFMWPNRQIYTGLYPLVLYISGNAPGSPQNYDMVSLHDISYLRGSTPKHYLA